MTTANPTSAGGTAFATLPLKDQARVAYHEIFHEPTYITPYLGLRSRVSQAWMNRWTILLFLVLVRLIIACADLSSDLETAQQQTLSSCTALEAVGSTMASAPHYMASGINQLTADGVEKAINGLLSMINLTVTGVEEIVVFIINLLTSTYVCLITLAVAGSLHAALAIIEDVAGFINKTLPAIGDDIQSAVTSFESDLNSVISGLNDVPKIFGSSSSIPTLNLDSEIAQLHNLSLPSGLDQGLSKLNASIPNFAQVNNFTNNVIRMPFEEIKKLLNQSHGNYTFDRTILPVPAMEQLSFCSADDGINSFFKGLIDVEITARSTTIAVLVILAVIVSIPMALREIYGWRTMMSRAHLVSENRYDELDCVYIISRPYSATAGIKAAGLVNGYRRKTLVRWVVAYITTPAALFVLSLGVAGLFSALCHYLIVDAVFKQVPTLAHEVDQYADKVYAALNNASVQWANGTNTAILDVNAKVNHDVFNWVNISTTAMNNTLNTFSDEMVSALNATFGGTILYQPMLEVYGCLIGLKIKGIEKGLTWVHDNAHVDFPLLPNNTFSLDGAKEAASNSSSTPAFLADPTSNSSSILTSAIDTLIDKYIRKVRIEFIISACVIGVWVLMLLMAIIRALYLALTSKGRMADERYTLTSLSPAPADPFADPITAHDEKRPSFVPSVAERSEPPTYPYDEPAKRGPDADSSGSNWRGTDYTLQPRPFPTFDARSPEINVQSPEGVVSPVDEKLGYAGERSVGLAVSSPGVARFSQHPDLLSRSLSSAARKPGMPTTFEQLGH